MPEPLLLNAYHPFALYAADEIEGDMDGAFDRNDDDRAVAEDDIGIADAPIAPTADAEAALAWLGEWRPTAAAEEAKLP
jgi:hypothetical protein